MTASPTLENVESKLFTTADFKLQTGVVLPRVSLAYETYGTLASDGRNAVLMTHGYTGSHHFAGRYRAGGAPRGLGDGDVGSWDKLIGPGKAIDTDTLFVVASNMLGSSYGSTNPASLNPETSKPYGPDFPAITVRDIIEAEKRLLDGLGVKHLVAVAGPSYGGYQAFQWAVSHPDFMDGIVPVVTAPRSQNAEKSLAELQARLATDPEWNGGRYYGTGGAKTVLTALRIEMLKRNGIEAALAPRYPDREMREVEIGKQAADWARRWDANSLVILRRGTLGFDTVKDFPQIKAKVLYVLCRTDRLFPPSIAPAVMKDLAAARVDARYFEIDSERGHSASGPAASTRLPQRYLCSRARTKCGDEDQLLGIEGLPKPE